MDLLSLASLAFVENKLDAILAALVLKVEQLSAECMIILRVLHCRVAQLGVVFRPNLVFFLFCA